MGESATTVLILRDRTLFWAGIQEILQGEEEISVIGPARSCEEALRLVGERHPDVVLLEAEPSSSVTISALLRRILAISPRSRVLGLGNRSDPLWVQKLLTAGAAGYLTKDVSRRELVLAIQGVGADDRRVIISFSRYGMPPVTSMVPLSKRELDVLELASAALSNAQIASQLSIAEATVKRHLRSAFVKLGAVSRIDAINKAVEASYILPPNGWEDRAPAQHRAR